MIYDLFGYFFEGDGIVCLLDGIDGVSFFFQGIYGVQGVLKILPLHAFFSTQSCLVQLLIRRTTADTAKHHFLYPHGIGRTKNSTYVMLATHIVQHHHQRQFIRFVVFRHTHAAHLGCGQFLTHNAKGKRT